LPTSVVTRSSGDLPMSWSGNFRVADNAQIMSTTSTAFIGDYPRQITS